MTEITSNVTAASASSQARQSSINTRKIATYQCHALTVLSHALVREDFLDT